MLRDLSRDIDEPARYGGEEMAVVLPQTDRGRGAARRAHAGGDRGASACRDSTAAGRSAVTASFGVASLPDSATDKASLIAAADAALYRAKRAGKNRVERAGGGHAA